MKKYFILFALFLLNISIFAADSNFNLDTFFSQDDIKTLTKGDLIARMYLKFNSRGENTHMNIEIPKTKYTDEDFEIYEALADDKAFIPYKLTNESKLRLVNNLTDFSGLKGSEYYSRSSGKVETLIVDCFRIDSPKTIKKLDNNVYTEIKPYIENYFFQQDNKFGKIVYKSELFNEGDNFVLVVTSAQPIKELNIDINSAGEYKILTFLIYNKEKEGYFYYSILAMRVKYDLALKNPLLLKPTTFSNRLRAGTVHLAKLMGYDLTKKLNNWDETKLKNGEYRQY
jgi:hypothetical protein